MNLLRLLVRTVAPLFAVPALLVSGAHPQESAQGIPIDDARRGELVEDLAEIIEEQYVFPDVAVRIAEHLRAQLYEKGAYDDCDTPRSLARALTRDLQSINGDRHLNVRAHQRVQAESETDAPSRAEVARQRLEAARRRNFGFERVERLEGNIGYLDLRSFSDARSAGDTAVAAMAFLANCDALIIDLRQNGGGSPSMIQLLSTYLFEEPTHLNSFFWRGQEQIDQTWTLPHVPGKRLVDVPLFILTSRSTFSAAEEFTYNLKNLERATIVGETTGGGAHPGEFVVVRDTIGVFVPRGRAINPITGTNWEGTGIEPHIQVTAGAALERARAEASEILDSRSVRIEQD